MSYVLVTDVLKKRQLGYERVKCRDYVIGQGELLAAHFGHTTEMTRIVQKCTGIKLIKSLTSSIISVDAALRYYEKNGLKVPCRGFISDNALKELNRTGTMLDCSNYSRTKTPICAMLHKWYVDFSSVYTVLKQIQLEQGKGCYLRVNGYK